jgi:hypothetical protein
MKTLIQKTFDSHAAKNFLKVSTLSVFGIFSSQASMNDMSAAFITIGVLLVGFIVAFAWVKMGSQNEA